MKAMALTAALLLGLAACGGDSVEATGLSDGAWVVERIGERKMTAPAPTIEFRKDGRFGGLASCNSYGGAYQASEGRLSLSGMFSTKMACAPELMAQEQALFDALGSGGGYRLGSASLTIEGAGGQRIEARRVAIRKE